MESEIPNNYPLSYSREESKSRKFYTFVIPLLVSVYFMAGFTQLKPEDKQLFSTGGDSSYSVKGKKFAAINIGALLANDQFSENLRDTVYTDKDKYLELRIDEQMLYVHYRDGSVKEYPVSSGNKFLEKGVESRPGLFAIFMKEEIHLSSQFDDAQMFYYMPFNMGIGFHSLAGTGYYGNLGVRPSSHGCIRMRTSDVKELFKECEIGTLVLAHRGKTARVVAFAPEGFENIRVYSKEEYMEMLAYNLNSLYQGRYLIDRPMRFIIDPAIIPKIGFNIGTTDDIPSRQQMPFMVEQMFQGSDKLDLKNYSASDVKENLGDEITGNFQFVPEDSSFSSLGFDVNKELIDKLVYNRIGILPYFPPDR